MELVTIVLTLLIIAIAIFAALYMAWSIGANDVANSMSTAVDAKAITLRQAIVIASVLNVCGAVLVGKHVTSTIQSGIVNTIYMSESAQMFGFLSALLAADIFVTFATWRELPVSTTHGVIGGVVGFGLIAGGAEMVNWGTIGKVAASWALSPIAGAIIAFVMFKIIARYVFGADEPVQSAKKLGPVFIALTFFLLLSRHLQKQKQGIFLGIPFMNI